MSALDEVKAFQKRERAKRKAGRGPTPLQRIICEINRYERQTNRDEYTDVGDVWEVFHFLRDIAKGKA